MPPSLNPTSRESFRGRRAARRSGRAAAVVAGWSLLFFLYLLVGCRGGTVERDALRTEDRPSEASSSRSPMLPRLENGLEYLRFAVDGGSETVARAMRPYADPDNWPEGFPSADRVELLRANGFRLAAVPVEEIRPFLAALPQQPVYDATWIGRATEWMSVASGSKIDGTRIFRINNELESMNEGQFQLLIRSYFVALPDRRLLRAEWLPRLLIEDDASFFNWPDGDDASRSALYTEFGLGVNFEGTHALVMAGESPNVDWNDLLNEEDNDDERGESGGEAAPTEAPSGESAKAGTNRDPTATRDPDADAGSEAADRDDGIASMNRPSRRDAPGPDPVPIRTIGEEILGSSDDARRMVILFVPHLRQNESNGPDEIEDSTRGTTDQGLRPADS